MDLYQEKNQCETNNNNRENKEKTYTQIDSVDAVQHHHMYYANTFENNLIEK